MCGYCRSELVRLLAKDIFVRKNNYSHSWKDKSCILEGSLQMICAIMLVNSLISHLSPFLHFVLSQWLSIPKWNCQNQFAIHAHLLQWLKDCLRLFFFLNLLICNCSSKHSMFPVSELWKLNKLTWQPGNAWDGSGRHWLAGSTLVMNHVHTATNSWQASTFCSLLYNGEHLWNSEDYQCSPSYTSWVKQGEIYNDIC